MCARACVCARVCVCACVCVKWKRNKEELSLAKNNHYESRGARPGSSTVVVNSIGLAICSVVQFWHKYYASA